MILYPDGGGRWTADHHQDPDGGPAYWPCQVGWLQPGQRILWSGYDLIVDDNDYGPTAPAVKLADSGSGAVHVRAKAATSGGSTTVHLHFARITDQVLAAIYNGPYAGS